MTEPSLRGELRENEPMDRHTSWRAGGAARRFYVPADVDDLALFLSRLPADEPLLWLGLGSNLLVRDGGFPGTVVATKGCLGGLERLGARGVRVGAGVTCNKLARFCAGHGLAGAEFLAGIPGAVGGALAMNAGAFGGETWRLVRAVETLDRAGGRHRRDASEYRVGYRSVRGPADEWFTAVEMELAAGDPAAVQARMKEHLEQRNRSQPTAQASCGSVFRNPPGDYAARLIDAAGLKGRAMGGACVSAKHANFIVNTGGATAADIEALIADVRDTVEAGFGVRLELEARIVGEVKGREAG